MDDYQKAAQVPIGQGDIDCNDFFKASKKGGLKNVYVEMAPDTFPESATFLQKLSNLLDDKGGSLWMI